MREAAVRLINTPAGRDDVSGGYIENQGSHHTEPHSTVVPAETKWRVKVSPTNSNNKEMKAQMSTKP